MRFALGFQKRTLLLYAESAPGCIAWVNAVRDAAGFEVMGREEIGVQTNDKPLVAHPSPLWTCTCTRSSDVFNPNPNCCSLSMIRCTFLYRIWCPSTTGVARTTSHHPTPSRRQMHTFSRPATCTTTPQQDSTLLRWRMSIAWPLQTLWYGQAAAMFRPRPRRSQSRRRQTGQRRNGPEAPQRSRSRKLERIRLMQQPAQVLLDQLLSDASATAATRAKTELVTQRSTQQTQEREQEEEREQVSLDQLLLDAQAAVAETAARKDVSARGALSTATSAIATSAPMKSAREASAKEEIAVEAVDSFDGGHPPFAIICTSPPGALQMHSVAARLSTSNLRV